MSAPTSRPVHPCVLSLTQYTRGVEHSVWAHITTDPGTEELPNLVTASASTICVYSLHPKTGILRLEHAFGNLAGSVIFLSKLSCSTEKDVLLVGFAGHPRIGVLSVTDSVLRAESLWDLSSSLKAAGHGEESVKDAVIECLSNQTGLATIGCILGGGISVALLQVSYSQEVRGWIAIDPFVLPLVAISQSFAHVSRDTSMNANVLTGLSSGFGDILSITFLIGFLESVVVLLHSAPGGSTTTFRLGRSSDESGAPPLYLTALSVGVSHQRAAVLWSRVVPSDVFSLCLLEHSSTLLCIGANTIVMVDHMSNIKQMIAVNGWAKTSCPVSLRSKLKPNPFMKLSLSLDGSCVVSLSDTCVLISLRGGQLYSLEYVLETWGIVPTGQTLGPIGQVAHLGAMSINNGFTGAPEKKGDDNAYIHGIMVAGSVLGDSLLLGYTLEVLKVSLSDSSLQLQVKDDVAPVKDKVAIVEDDASTRAMDVDEAGDDAILRMEEEALYLGSVESKDSANIVPPSDEDESSSKRSRVCVTSVLHSLTPVDSLVNPGPLGRSCIGPIAATPEFLRKKADVSASQEQVFSSSAHIFPSGFGSGGGIGVVTHPGMDDRLIVAEEDTVGVQRMFSLQRSLLLAMWSQGKSSVRVLRLNAITNNEVSVEEVSDFPGMDPGAELIAAGELGDHSVLITRSPSADDEDEHSNAITIYSPAWTVTSFQEIPTKAKIEQVTTVLTSAYSPGFTLVGCLWVDGRASVLKLSLGSDQKEICIPQAPKGMSNTEGVKADNDLSSRIVSIDVFTAPAYIFVHNDAESVERIGKIDWNSMTVVQLKAALKERNLPTTGRKADLISTLEADASSTSKDTPAAEESVLDEDDQLLYGPLHDVARKGSKSSSHKRNEALLDYVAICRQSGRLDVYCIDKDNALKPVWHAHGVGFGERVLSRSSSSMRSPRTLRTFANEIRFFHCGPSKHEDKSSLSYLRSFCFISRNTLGDVHLYKADVKKKLSFHKVPVNIIGRTSKDQMRHKMKLVKKKATKKQIADVFQERVFTPFNGLSGQDGLFYAGAMPGWLLGERGLPCFLEHRTRYAAPAGGSERPLRSFCSSNGFYITTHERVGKIGSQRLTIFNKISTSLDGAGVFMGCGLSFERRVLGVTVRQIEFIEDAEVSNGSRPLYAFLVSREVDADQSSWNSDGLSNVDRDELKKKKEEEMLRRQVEADLGGFDMQSEWVEEIEREDCFGIDVTLGGAPCAPQPSYSIWIVDASNNWDVVDTFELEENEHGLTMSMITLTEAVPDAGEGPSDNLVDGSELKNVTFLAVGTGVVDHDGEDVGAKGRALLLQVKPSENRVAEISLVYQKDVYHGPVSSLSCLSVEGCNRLVIGAGSDVNIEQWGNEMLTQVGFFRATMDILDIRLFKNFFLLSDAYDSLHFLVWRESDKSLTLLAKDYDPIPVVVSGLMSRGPTMTFAGHDIRQNLQFFQYAPGEAASRGGNKLVVRADFHLGASTTALVSFPCRSSLIAHSATPKSSLAALRQQDPKYGQLDDDQRVGVYFGSSDGGMGVIVPLSEPTYWRFTALQSVMANALMTNCALNQKAWRLYRRSTHRGGCRTHERKRSVIDGNLIFRFIDLPIYEQEDLASSIGSTVDMIVDNLLELRSSSIML